MQRRERRSATRKLTQTRVMLHHSAFDDTPLLTKDMSEGGVFVETSNAQDLTPGTTFAMTFMVNLGSITRLHKVSATVVQSTPEGLRLRFQ